MAFETWWNNPENQSFERSKNLIDLDISYIEESSKLIHDIQAMELADNEDNHVTIPDDLKDFFWDELNENNEVLSKLEEFKQGLYEKLWLNENLEQNTDIQKFEKWFVDWLLVENIETLDNLLDKWIDELVTMIQNLANWDVIVAILEDMYDSIWDILNVFKDPYEWWKALWWFWLWVVGKWMKWVKIAEKMWDKLDSNSLYENPNYDFLDKPELREYFWDIDKNDIIWEWENWIILRHPIKDDWIVKIAKPWDTDSIEVEFSKHQQFYNELKNLKREYKINWKEEYVSHYFIPNIKKPNWLNWVFEMQKIEWQNYVTKFYLEHYRKELSDLDRDYLEWLPDWQVERILEDRKLMVLPKTASELDNFWYEIPELDLENAFERYWNWWSEVK